MRVLVAGVGDPDHCQISTEGSEEKRRFYCERHCLKGKARTKTSLLRRYGFFGFARRRTLTTRREDEPEKESSDQAAEVRRHAHLWRRKIEGDLNHYDQPNVCQALSRLRRMTMSQ